MYFNTIFLKTRKKTKIAATAHVETQSEGQDDHSERAAGAEDTQSRALDPRRPGGRGQAKTSPDWVTLWPPWESG